jgi:hypothetical protein
MKSPSLRRVVARRVYDLAGSVESASSKVTLEFSAPLRIPRSNSYACFYRVEGLQASGTRFGAGTDAVQALVLATANAATLLYNSDEWKGGRLTLYGSRNLDLPVIRTGDESIVPEQMMQLDL